MADDRQFRATWATTPSLGYVGYFSSKIFWNYFLFAIKVALSTYNMLNESNDIILTIGDALWKVYALSVKAISAVHL